MSVVSGPCLVYSECSFNVSRAYYAIFTGEHYTSDYLIDVLGTERVFVVKFNQRLTYLEHLEVVRKIIDQIEQTGTHEGEITVLCNE